MANEFRHNPVSGEWAVIAPSRAHRPQPKNRERLKQTREECPFEPGKLDENGTPLIAYDHGRLMPWHGDWLGRWTTVVVPNKFPVLTSGVCGDPVAHGPSLVHPAHGFHELVITRDHDRLLADLSTEELTEVLAVYKDRLRAIAEQDCGAYIYICHNQGLTAGASIAHNHTQIFTSPVMPPGILRALTSTTQYDAIIEYERSQGARMVYDNEQFLVFCPFASRVPYEMYLFPKVQAARFEASTPEVLVSCADALGTVLRKLNQVLDTPDYNLVVHTAPAKDRSYDDSYYWHIEILPRTTVQAAFEISTDIFVNPSDPDECAKQLREANV